MRIWTHQKPLSVTLWLELVKCERKKNQFQHFKRIFLPKLNSIFESFWTLVLFRIKSMNWGQYEFFLFFTKIEFFSPMQCTISTYLFILCQQFRYYVSIFFQYWYRYIQMLIHFSKIFIYVTIVKCIFNGLICMFQTINGFVMLDQAGQPLMEFPIRRAAWGIYEIDLSKNP